MRILAAAGGAFTLGKKRPIAGRSTTRSGRRFGGMPSSMKEPLGKRAPKWRDRQSGLGSAPLPTLRFPQHETVVCFPRIKTLQERLWPQFSRAAIFRALDRLEAAGIVRRVSQAHEERGETCAGRNPLRVRPDHRSRAEHGAEGEGACQGDGARDPASLWPRRPSESQSVPVPSENLIFRSKSGEKPALEVATCDRASIGLQMRDPSRKPETLAIITGGGQVIPPPSRSQSG